LLFSITKVNLQQNCNLQTKTLNGLWPSLNWQAFPESPQTQRPCQHSFPLVPQRHSAETESSKKRLLLTRCSAFFVREREKYGDLYWENTSFPKIVMLYLDKKVVGWHAFFCLIWQSFKIFLHVVTLGKYLQKYLDTSLTICSYSRNYVTADPLLANVWNKSYIAYKKCWFLPGIFKVFFAAWLLLRPCWLILIPDLPNIYLHSILTPIKDPMIADVFVVPYQQHYAVFIK